MNKRNFLTTLFVSLSLSIVLVMSSCSKDESIHRLPNATITINSPVANAVYQPNDTVKISATIASDSVLHGYTIYIRKRSDKSSLFALNVHDHLPLLTVDQFWVNTLTTDTTNVELEIIAALDHDGNSIGKKVNFTCVP